MTICTADQATTVWMAAPETILFKEAAVIIGTAIC